MDVRKHRNAHGRRTIARTIVAAALVAGWAAAAVLLWRDRVPALEVESLDPSAVIAGPDIERAEEYRALMRWLWVATVVAQLSVLALLAWKGRSLAAVATRAGRGRVRGGIAAAVLVAVAVWAAALVPEVVAHWWSRRYGLAVQGYAGWLADRAIGLVPLVALTALAVGVCLMLARRFGRRWWIPGAAAFAVLGVVVVLLQPVVVEPLLTRTRPLVDPGLEAAIVAMGARLGVDVGEVDVAEASARTTAPNARVTGLGPTRRITIDDTMLDGRFDPAAVRAVAAHELAHVARNHVWKGVAWFALLVVPCAAVLAWLVARRGDLGGENGPALVPLALLVAFCLYLAALPVVNAISRRYEREADWLALIATDEPEASAALVRGIARAALVDPDPPAWSRVLLGTHPPAVDRLAMALAFERR